MAGSHPRALMAAIVVSGLGLAGTLVAGPTVTAVAAADAIRRSAPAPGTPAVTPAVSVGGGSPDRRVSG